MRGGGHCDPYSGAMITRLERGSHSRTRTKFTQRCTNTLRCFVSRRYGHMDAQFTSIMEKVITDTHTRPHTHLRGLQYFGSNQPVYEWIIQGPCD